MPARLEELKPGSPVRGIVPGEAVLAVAVEWHGTSCVTLTYRNAGGEVAQRLVYRADQDGLDVDDVARSWTFDADGHLFRLAAEARRIRLAYLFDPRLAVHLSLLEPLTHQIKAVYGDLLPRQPLRFALCDDPGAGKTIMAGLYIKELLLRGALRRCLVVAPGALVSQWQDELAERFGMPFSILTRGMIEASRLADPFTEHDLLIARLDHLSRDDDLVALLAATEWDLVVVDEAHRMSAHYFGSELKETRRYRLGKVLGQVARHFLLMTATPHAGKDEDFQLFLALLDPDRFEGKPPGKVRKTDVSDLIRRTIKERLLRFDGRPLFPERRATVATPKSGELIAAPYRHGGSIAAATEYFVSGFTATFRRLSEVAVPTLPMLVVYAHRQEESENGGVTSTAWDAMLTAILAAGLRIVGTWPIHATGSSRQIGLGTNALASYVVLVCRPQVQGARIVDRQGFFAALRAELPRAIRKLQEGAISSIDLGQATIGPGMAIFSKFAKVIEPSGQAMTFDPPSNSSVRSSRRCSTSSWGTSTPRPGGR